MTLFILAAGMGSRYGGLKQIDPFTEYGEFILDFSIYDAILAGFDHVVFVIKKENYEIFKRTVGHRIEGKIHVDYVFQGLDTFVPADKIPEGRTKPWGTTHAVLCGKEVLKDGFVVINADDFYGRDTFMQAASFLHDKQNSHGHYSMIGYLLENTLTENGSVARGECHANADSMLVRIEERTKLFKEDSGAYYSDENGNPVHLPGDTIVSMNCWCFTPDVLAYLEKDFLRFLDDPTKDPLKGEAFLPNAVGRMMSEGFCDVKVLKTHAKWFGVTYAADKPDVLSKLHALIESGEYPKEGLWK